MKRIELIEDHESGNYQLLMDLEGYTLKQFINAVQWKIPDRQLILESEFSDKFLARELVSLLQSLEKQPTCSLTQSYRQV